ncbi:hypothetical protein VT84_38510 [Gemmata sp. SH-PL17]|nr:hypothetical protein VT84_38510 [Gemmata sp. SH-PL17]
MSIAYGFVFTVLASVAALVAISAPSWPLRGAGIACVFSFLLVAVAYFGAGPRLLFKRTDGRRVAWVWGVHWPYFALTAFSYWLAVLFGRESAFVCVAPNVYLGRRLTRFEANQTRVNWHAVLDLVAEMPEPWPLRSLGNYRSLLVLDATAMSLAQLRDSVAWVAQFAAIGPVYVHCALGHSRSATVVAAYLLAAGLAPDVRTALRTLRELRPGVRPSRAQRQLLDRFAEEIRITSEPST